MYKKIIRYFIKMNYSKKIFYKIDDAINASIDSKTVFILANERKTESGRIGRYYTIFPRFKNFLNVREKYPHCHEILIDHVNNKPNFGGRLVFDFDIKLDDDIVIPSNFKFQVEDTITTVIDDYFKKVDSNIFDFIWSTSQNPKKFSKHLTVKNLYFDDWISMSKKFYKLFCIIWDRKYYWIGSDKLIDCQIVRKRASLRMVGSSKIDGFPLKFDDDNHNLVDSLIRIYFISHKKSEQLVTCKNINSNGLDELDEPEKIKSVGQNKNINRLEFSTGPSYPLEVYQTAFVLLDKIIPNVFKMGKINGIIMSLYRIKKYSCLISGRVHENENAYCVIHIDQLVYDIYFGCYRSCGKKMHYVGTLTIDGLCNIHDPCLANTELIYHKKIYKKTHEMIDGLSPGTFEIDKINRNVMFLKRIKPGKCILSRKTHKTDDAYCIINQTEKQYNIIFGCIRKNIDCKHCQIGILTIPNLCQIIEPVFDPNLN